MCVPPKYSLSTRKECFHFRRQLLKFIILSSVMHIVDDTSTVFYTYPLITFHIWENPQMNFYWEPVQNQPKIMSPLVAKRYRVISLRHMTVKTDQSAERTSCTQYRACEAKWKCNIYIFLGNFTPWKLFFMYNFLACSHNIWTHVC